MAVNGIELAVGQRWKTRDGTEVEIVRRNGQAAFPWDFRTAMSFESCSEGGRYIGLDDHPLDLIELVPLTSAHPWPYPATLVAPTEELFPPKENPGTTINPKDAIGSTKLPLHLWPAEATALGCLGMLEGAEKYGRNNYVAGEGVIASIYVDAAKRHLDAWFAGEECAPDSGSPHLANALATIAILVKADAHGRLIDDRDYSPEREGAAYRRFVDRITPHVARIKTMFASKKPKHFTIKEIL